jgi:hypothetical protein
VRVFVEFVSNVDQRERASELAGEQVCVCVCERERVCNSLCLCLLVLVCLSGAFLVRPMLFPPTILLPSAEPGWRYGNSAFVMFLEEETCCLSSTTHFQF